MILESFEIPIYRGKLVVLISDKLHEVKKYLPNFKESFPEGNVKTIYAHSIVDNFRDREGYYIVLNFKNKYRKIKHGTITHECVHIANMLLSGRGVVADFNNDEAHAYLSEWICDRVYKVFKRNGLKAV